MAVEQLARIHADYQSQLADAAVYGVQEFWSQVDPNNISASWASMLPDAVGLMTQTQLIAATDASAYVQAALASQGLDNSGSDLVPGAFAGHASDGRSMVGLLSSPAYTALQGIGAGMDVDRAMAAGSMQLTMLASTTISDTGRVAAGSMITSRLTTTGYVRMLNPPSCSRCAILAGRYYKWNSGFERHPRCKCIHIPTSENNGRDLRTDPYSYFESLSAKEQDKLFTNAGAQAIRDGADINQVVNSRRGMSTTVGGSVVTTEGTTRRGYFGSQQITRDARKALGERYGVSIRQRMMPEEIYKRANSREEAIRLLTEYGYITPAGQVQSAIVGEARGFSGGRSNRYAFDN